MNGIHDMGGMHGFGPIPREIDEPVFHAEWERRMFAMALAALGRRIFNVDEFRRAIERIPPADYLRSSYYERWMRAFVALLAEKRVASAAELTMVFERADRGLESGVARASGNSPERAAAPESPATPGAGGHRLRDDPNFPARFKIGDRVIARNLNPEHHTRLPRYARGRRGVIRHDWGVFVLPDTHAHGGGPNPRHCYSVEFDGRELWGEDHPAGAAVLVDLWEPYLEPAAAEAGGSRTRGARKATRTRAPRAGAHAKGDQR